MRVVLLAPTNRSLYARLVLAGLEQLDGVSAVATGNGRAGQFGNRRHKLAGHFAFAALPGMKAFREYGVERFLVTAETVQQGDPFYVEELA